MCGNEVKCDRGSRSDDHRVRFVLIVSRNMRSTCLRWQSRWPSQWPVQRDVDNSRHNLFDRNLEFKSAPFSFPQWTGFIMVIDWAKNEPAHWVWDFDPLEQTRGMSEWPLNSCLTGTPNIADKEQWRHLNRCAPNACHVLLFQSKSKKKVARKRKITVQRCH